MELFRESEIDFVNPSSLSSLEEHALVYPKRRLEVPSTFPFDSFHSGLISILRKTHLNCGMISPSVREALKKDRRMWNGNVSGISSPKFQNDHRSAFSVIILSSPISGRH